MYIDPETRTVLLDAPAETRHLGPAEVVLTHEKTATVSLGVQQVDATIAVQDYLATPGDQVLVIGDNASGYYIIGVLHAPDRKRQLSVDCDSEKRRTRIAVEEGDLELVAPSGSIRLIAGGGVDITSMQPIDVRSRVAVRMSVFGGVGKVLSKFCLTGRRTELQNEHIVMESGNLRLKSEQAAIESDRFKADIDVLDASARRVSLAADVLFTTASSVYHKVAQLWQLAAGRTRMVVDETSHHKAKRIYSKAVEDVKVNAKKIHLG